MPKQPISLEKAHEILSVASNAVVNSFSGMNRILSSIPGIFVTIKTNDTGVLPVLATLFDTSELADSNPNLPRQTSAQSITLEVHTFPDKLCIKPTGTVDYIIGFRLGKKFAEIGYGWYHDMLEEVVA